MIAILKYNAGNVTSVENAVKNLGYSTVVTDDIEVLKS
jgi:glutamine amidotransferase